MSTPPSQFLALPRELRDAIYELCIPKPPVIDLGTGEHPLWLLTSEQIFHEAAPMVYDRCCFYQIIAYKYNPSLLDQLFTNYISSIVPTSTPQVLDLKFARVKRMISYLAIDVHLDVTVDQVGWLCKDYFDRVEELTNLKGLFISLNPRPGMDYSSFMRQLSRSDLRIFQVVLFVEAVKVLMDRAPKGCKIYWSIPQSIRMAAHGGSRCPERNYPEITGLMREVNQAVSAMEPQDGPANQQVVSAVSEEAY